MAKVLQGKRGRKNKYFTHVHPRLEEIAHWCRDGLTEEEICKRLGVSVPAFANYKKEFIELIETLKVNREIADYHVEDSLYMRALGYEYEEETYEEFALDRPYIKDDGTIVRTELRLTKKVKKKQAPDVTAQIFWLKNRRSDKWRDKQDIEHTGSVDHKLDLSGLTAEELRKLANSDR